MSTALVDDTSDVAQQSIDLPKLIRDRFIQRRDIWARQWYNAETKEGGYVKAVQGECTNDPPCTKRFCAHKTPVPLSRQDVVNHLNGKLTIGVYQLGVDDTVKWVCFDVDIAKGNNIEDPLSSVRTATRRLVKVLNTLGVPFLVEASGNRGYHVWVFFSEPVGAANALALGRHAADSVEAVDGITIEVFPKQVSAKSLGNLVKLPLGVHQKTKNRCLFVDAKFRPIENQARALANVVLVTPQRLIELIEQHHMAVPEYRKEVGSSSFVVGEMTPPCMHNVMLEGVYEGGRDDPTFRLSCYLRDRGLPMDLALAAMREWNQRNHPPLEDDRLISKIESAYSSSYSFFPCHLPTFDRYCRSTCRYFERRQSRKRIGAK